MKKLELIQLSLLFAAVIGLAISLLTHIQIIAHVAGLTILILVSINTVSNSFKLLKNK